MKCRSISLLFLRNINSSFFEAAGYAVLLSFSFCFSYRVSVSVPVSVWFAYLGWLGLLFGVSY